MTAATSGIAVTGSGRGWRLLSFTALAMVVVLGGLAAAVALVGPPDAQMGTIVRLPPEVTVPLPPAEPEEKPAEVAVAPPVADPAAQQPVAPPTLPSSGPVPIPPAAQVPRAGPVVKSKPLTPAPDAALVEKAKDGLLPIIGRDGRQAWQVYARPFEASDTRPRVAILMVGLGLGAAETAAAINQLPGSVSLAFTPHSRRLTEWTDLARAAGHEILLNLPMEPIDYPRTDPGLNTLLASLDRSENLQRLNWVLSRATGYVGVVSFMGSRFSTSRDDLKPILEALKARGLMYVDNRASTQSVAVGIATELKLPLATNSRFIDTDASRAAIDKRLAELEDIAKRQGVAVGIGNGYPVTIERLGAWSQDLESRGVVLAPVSAAIAR
jgi:polysaccharide deacetylase 2 family uncharacterized protein YibQ